MTHIRDRFSNQEYTIQLTAAGVYVDVNNPTASELLLDAETQGGGVNSVISLAGSQYRVNSDNSITKFSELIQIPTVADLSSNQGVEDGSVVKLLGYYSAGDSGNQDLIYRSTGRTGITVDGGDFFAGHDADDYYEALDKTISFVDRFGADPSGVLDSGPAINNALLASRVNVVEFNPDGEYLIGTNVLYSNSVGVKRVVGNNATLKSGVSGDMFRLTCDVEIENLVFDATGRTDTERLVRLGGTATTNCKVSGCTFQNIYATTFAQGASIGAFNSIEVDNCHFINIRAEKNDVGGDTNGSVRGLYFWRNCTSS